MANPKHVDILKQGVEEWNAWRRTSAELPDLSGANLYMGNLSGANFYMTRLDDARLESAQLFRANLDSASLKNANLERANLESAVLTKAVLSEAILRGAILDRATLTGAKLTKANLETASLAKANLDGVYLNEARMFKANLREASLRNARLKNVNLNKADLEDANFKNAILIKANLHNVNLREAKLKNAKLEEAELNGAILIGANFLRTSLKRTDLSETQLDGTVFSGVNLSTTIGLDRCTHKGPSTIDNQTLSMSPNLPTEFLQGIGLRDSDIEYQKLNNPSLSPKEKIDIVYRLHDLYVDQAIQISPLFISYSHQDKDFVDALESKLDKKGIRYWRDIHQSTAGRIDRQIDRAIRLNPTVLLILSKHSVMSDWVEYEAHLAKEIEKELERDVLCPVALDDSWKNSKWNKPLRKQIEKYNILDFNQWKDENEFTKQFFRLVDGLDIYYD